MSEERYFRVSDLRKLCDDSRDWGVPMFTLNDLLKHGHWIVTDNWRICRCSNCDGAEFVDWALEQAKYCPNCGAKMDEETVQDVAYSQGEFDG